MMTNQNSQHTKNSVKSKNTYTNQADDITLFPGDKVQGDTIEGQAIASIRMKYFVFVVTRKQVWPAIDGYRTFRKVQ